MGKKGAVFGPTFAFILKVLVFGLLVLFLFSNWNTLQAALSQSTTKVLVGSKTLGDIDWSYYGKLKEPQKEYVHKKTVEKIEDSFLDGNCKDAEEEYTRLTNSEYGKNREGVEDFQIQEEKQKLSELTLELARCHKDKKDYTRARELIDSFLANYPDHPKKQEAISMIDEMLFALIDDALAYGDCLIARGLYNELKNPTNDQKNLYKKRLKNCDSTLLEGASELQFAYNENKLVDQQVKLPAQQYSYALQLYASGDKVIAQKEFIKLISAYSNEPSLDAYEDAGCYYVALIEDETKGSCDKYDACKESILNGKREYISVFPDPEGEPILAAILYATGQCHAKNTKAQHLLYAAYNQLYSLYYNRQNQWIGYIDSLYTSQCQIKGASDCRVINSAVGYGLHRCYTYDGGNYNPLSVDCRSCVELLPYGCSGYSQDKFRDSDWKNYCESDICGISYDKRGCTVYGNSCLTR